MSKRKIYFEICEKHDTNLNEIFDYLCQDYHKKKDSYRFELLRNIYQQGYNLQDVLDSFKYHNNYLKDITFTISLSLFFFIKYIKEFHIIDCETNDAFFQIFAAHVRAEKISEEKLMDIIINYMATEKLSLVQLW